MSEQEQLPPAVPGPTRQLARGAAIGRYLVLDLVGQGTMGKVYAAYDPELGRKVALKLLRGRFAGAAGADDSAGAGRTRLLREAQAAARLSHENVVVIFDVGTFGDAVFLAMEFIDGDTIGKWRQTGERGWQDVLRVFLAAGRGLAAAHAAGLIHRDFKPENVMVGRDGKVRVMDFGLARQVAAEVVGQGPAGPAVAAAQSVALAPAPLVAIDLDATSVIPPSYRPAALRASASDLTQTGSTLGTPAYMAPEQLASRTADARSDQFSFCVALHEALCGVRPFQGDSLTALAENIAAGRVRGTPPGRRPPPPWILKVLLRGLNAAPEDRYATMDLLLAALQRDPRVAHRRWAMRAGAALLAVGLAVAASRGLHARRAPCQSGGDRLAGIWETGGAASPRRQAIRAAFTAGGDHGAQRAFENAAQILDRYVAEWTAVYRNACEATSLRGEQSAAVLDLRMSCLRGRLESVRALTDVFLRADGPVIEKAASAARALAPLERCSDLKLLRAVVKPPDDPAVRARVNQLRRRLAEIKALGDAGRLGEARARGQPLLEEARALGYAPVIAEVLTRIGWVSMGRPADAEIVLDEAAWTATASGDDELFAEAAIAQVFNVGFLQAEPERAQPWIRIAEATLVRIRGHQLLRAWLINNQGAVLFAQGRNEEAVAAFTRSAELKEEVLGPDSPDVASSLGNRGDPLAKLGRFEEALRVNQRALQILEATGEDHLDMPVYLSARGEYLNALGRFVEAEALARRALALWERRLDTDNANVAYALTVIGRSYLQRDRSHEAVAPLLRAYELRRRLDPDPSRLGETAFALAQALWRSHGDRPRALVLAAEAERAYAATHETQTREQVHLWLARHE